MSDVIRCQNIACGYRGIPVLRHVSLRLAQGESVLLIGHNGAGKSTLLRSLFALQPLLGGRAAVAGFPLNDADPQALLLRGVRFLAQGPRAFTSLTVAGQRGVLPRLYGMSQPNRGKSEAFSPVSETAWIGGLSGGQRRLETLRMLSAGDPHLFLLDEPLAGVDHRNGEAIRHWVGERQAAGVSFVIADHQFRDFLTQIPTAMVLRRGTVTFYGRSDDLRSEASLAEVFL